jgi:hypothetical protein
MAVEFGILRDGIEPTRQLLPPGTKTSSKDYIAPSATAGSFLVGEFMRQVDPERMVPTEEVMPGVQVPLLIVPNVGAHGRWDLDHTRFQINDPRLIGDNRPLRYCFCQYVPRGAHERKNDAYDAVEMPVDPHAVFQAVLLGIAQYVPQRVIDLSTAKPVVYEASDSLRNEIRRHVAIQPYTSWRIGFYAANYILANGMEAIRETEEVGRFLGAKDEQARKIASYGVVRRAVGVVLDTFEPTYERARRRGAIRRPEATAARFVSRYFDQRQPDYVPVIAEALLGAVA